MEQPPPDNGIDRRRRARMARTLAQHRWDDAPIQRPCPTVILAMAATPRHWFVPEDARGQAYDDDPLPIGAGQTISQPRLVAEMLTLLQLRPGQRVLDVGCGSGYVTALLAQLVGSEGEVVGVERQATLIERAQRRCHWCQHMLPAMSSLTINLADAAAIAAPSSEAPLFDRIHLGCAAAAWPEDIALRLAPQGVMILPLKNDNEETMLVVARRRGDDGWQREVIHSVSFVPLLPGVAAAGVA